MKYPVLKSIGAGILIGIALFAFPLTIRIIGAVVFIGFLVRLIRGPRWHKYHHMHMAWAHSGGPMPLYFAKMSEEDRNAFMQKMRSRGCYHYAETVEEKEEKTTEK